jgi:hypothetical protein
MARLGTTSGPYIPGYVEESQNIPRDAHSLPKTAHVTGGKSIATILQFFSGLLLDMFQTILQLFSGVSLDTFEPSLLSTFIPLWFSSCCGKDSSIILYKRPPA